MIKTRIPTALLAAACLLVPSLARAEETEPTPAVACESLKIIKEAYSADPESFVALGTTMAALVSAAGSAVAASGGTRAKIQRVLESRGEFLRDSYRRVIKPRARVELEGPSTQRSPVNPEIGARAKGYTIDGATVEAAPETLRSPVNPELGTAPKGYPSAPKVLGGALFGLGILADVLTTSRASAQGPREAVIENPSYLFSHPSYSRRFGAPAEGDLCAPKNPELNRLLNGGDEGARLFRATVDVLGSASLALLHRDDSDDSSKRSSRTAKPTGCDPTITTCSLQASRGEAPVSSGSVR